MNEVGKLPAPKAWSLCVIKETGKLDLGYAHSKPWKKMRELEEGAAEVLKRIPKNPGLPRYPALHTVDIVHRKFTPLTTEQQAENNERLAAYEQQVKDCDEHHQATHAIQRHALDYMPIYEEELEFLGHGRGMSSFTLQFKATDGQELEFGPSGSSDLVRSILEGKSLVVGGKLKVRFTFAKKGSNIYAEVHHEGV